MVYQNASDHMFYVQTTFYGFLVLDIITLIIAVMKICSAMGAKKKGQEMAAEVKQQESRNMNNGYDPLLYSN